VDYNCPEPYLREESLIEQLLGIIDTLDIQYEVAEPGLLKAIDTYQEMLATANVKTNQKEAFHGYAKYVLEKGSDFEKSRLVRCIDKKLGIRDRQIVELD
jgi:hypothetical protein